MAERSKIEWTDSSWTPLKGCRRISNGCENCYAERFAWRNASRGGAYEGVVELRSGLPIWTGETRWGVGRSDSLVTVKKWRKPRLIFVNSMGDLFYEGHEDEAILEVWRAMERAPHHIYQVLTKRPARMADWLRRYRPSKVPPTIWVGTSVCWGAETRRDLGRLDALAGIDAWIRWVSAEPLLGKPPHADHAPWEALSWIVMGGETGERARVPEEGIVEALCRQLAVGQLYCIPSFVKQMGSVWLRENGIAPWLEDDDMKQWPENLQTREYPKRPDRMPWWPV